MNTLYDYLYGSNTIPFNLYLRNVKRTFFTCSITYQINWWIYENFQFSARRNSIIFTLLIAREEWNTNEKFTTHFPRKKVSRRSNWKLEEKDCGILHFPTITGPTPIIRREINSWSTNKLLPKYILSFILRNITPTKVWNLKKVGKYWMSLQIRYAPSFAKL